MLLFSLFPSQKFAITKILPMQSMQISLVLLRDQPFFIKSNALFHFSDAFLPLDAVEYIGVVEWNFSPGIVYSKRERECVCACSVRVWGIYVRVHACA